MFGVFYNVRLLVVRLRLAVVLTRCTGPGPGKSLPELQKACGPISHHRGRRALGVKTGTIVCGNDCVEYKLSLPDLLPPTTSPALPRDRCWHLVAAELARDPTNSSSTQMSR
jgi:hypothetical protein